MKKKILIMGLVVLMILVFGIMGAKSYIEGKLENLSGMDISNVDLSKVKDGVYAGSYKVFPVEAEVEVTVSSHRISEIKLIKHNNGQGKPAEVIPGKVVEAQTLEVDIVSGATYSSKVILKAIQNALESAY